MSNKKTHKSDSQPTTFHQRLKELLQEDVDGWAKKLGVSSSLIRGRWFNGSYPGVDKIIKLIEISDVSPSYLLTGYECDTCENAPHFSQLARNKYECLKTVTVRINRAARQQRSCLTMAGIVKYLMEAEIIDQQGNRARR